MLTGLALLASFPPAFLGDGVLRFADLEALVNGSLPHERFSLVGPVLSLPLWPLGNIVGNAPHDAVVRFDLVLVALSLPTFWLLLRDRMASETLRCFLLLLLVCSLLGHETAAYGAEVLTALLVGVGAILVTAEGRGARIGWAALVIGAWNIPPPSRGSR